MKLTKAKIKIHNEVMEVLKKDVLSFEEKYFVLENFNEAALHINSQAGAFFTPVGLCKDFSLEIYEGGKIIDMCAGIGKLAFFANHWKGCEVTCVEFNPDYVEVGKKILPEANWICGSIFDLSDELQFDQSISNPPFGKIKTGLSDVKYQYTGSEFEFLTIEKASKISDYGTFILPQMSTPFKYSGQRDMERQEVEKVKKFEKQTGLLFEMNVGIDTACYLEDWNGVSPLCEIVNFEFKSENKKPEPQLELFLQ